MAAEPDVAVVPVVFERGLLCRPDVEVYDPEPFVLRILFGGPEQLAGQAVARAPRAPRNASSGCRQTSGPGCCTEAGAPGRTPAIAPSSHPTNSVRSGIISTPAPVGFEHVPGRRPQPAEPAAGLDRVIRDDTQVVQVSGAQGLDPLDPDCRWCIIHDQGCQRRKLARIRRPADWLFSGWNWVPTMVSRPTAAVTGPP